jgi:hypothetical protein
MSSVANATVLSAVLNLRNALSEQGSASVGSMKRTMWTDERLDERFDGIDRRFDAVDKRFDGVDRSLERIDHDIRDLRTLMFMLWGPTMLGILATIGTVIATNV